MSFLSHVRVGEEIARGGMGTVHLAFREVGPFRRTLALKRPLGGKTGTDAEQELLHEARLAAQVRHPNVIEVLDVGVDEDGLFLVMDYVEGLSLRDAGQFPLQLTLWIVRCVASALEAAHDGEQAIVHRDVSPGNIMVGYDGSVRLMDFGLARPVQDPRTSRYLRGSPGYVAPETLRFDPIDTSADIFALGIILHELISGTRLYGDTDIRVVAKRILEEEPPALAASPTLGALVARMLAKDTAARPSAAEVVRLVEAERRALVRSEGALLLATHMSDVFGDQLAKKRRWLRDQWAAAEMGKAQPSELPKHVAPAPIKKRGHGKPIIVASALVALCMIGFSAIEMQRPPASIVKTLAPAPPPDPVDVVEVEAGPERDPGEPDFVEPDPVELEAAPTPAREPRTPRMRRVRMRNESAPTKMGRDLWGW